MRLIDAGHLYNEVEKLKESPWFNDDTNGARIIRREALNIVEDLCICKAPTVCDIDAIRAEIEQIKPYELPWDKRTPEHIKDMALEIIEKYANQEPCDDDYQTDMDEAWKQAKREPCDDVVSRQAVLDIVKDMRGLARADVLTDAIKQIEKLSSVRPLEPTGKCRTCKYGEIYNDLWCKCHDPLLDGVMVKMTEKCRAEEIIELNRKYKAERSDKE